MQGFLRIVNSLIRRDDSEIFREPVDWESLGLVDYPEIVTQPMDLKTVKQNCINGRYDGIQDAAEDVRRRRPKLVASPVRSPMRR